MQNVKRGPALQGFTFFNFALSISISITFDS